MFPRAADEVSREFVQAALQLPAGAVTEVRAEPLTGERGMSGILVRLHLAGLAGQVPAAVIGKFPLADPAQRAQLDAMGFCTREVSFYRTVARATPVHTPVCYFAGLDPDTGDTFLLLEDLAPARNGSVAGATVGEVTAVLHALAQLHAHWWEDATLAEQSWTRLPSMLAPSAVAEVFEQSWPSFLSKLSGPNDRELTDVKAWISSELGEAAATLLERGPRTLIHNDVQADNLFFSPESGRPVIFIDWQLTTCGRGVVDVASAVRSTLDTDVRRRAEPALLRLYHDALVQAGVQDYPFAQCEADYQLATVLAPARLASAVGLIRGLHAHPGAPWDTLFPRLTSR